MSCSMDVLLGLVPLRMIVVEISLDSEETISQFISQYQSFHDTSHTDEDRKSNLPGESYNYIEMSKYLALWEQSKTIKQIKKTSQYSTRASETQHLDCTFL